MTNPPDITPTTGARHRKPRAGERTRGAVDALQTKIAVGLQNLHPENCIEQLQVLVDELPDATGTDAAFVSLIGDDGTSIETVLASCNGFAQCSPGVLAGEKLDDWPWLRQRLDHLRVVEVADTMNGPAVAKNELEHLNELHIGCLLYTSDAADDSIRV